MNRTALAVCAAAVTGIQVGAAITATRYVATDISPAALAFLRYAVGVACLLPAIALARRVRFAAADILPIALLGIGQFGVLIALLNYGLKSVPAARAALIFASFPHPGFAAKISTLLARPLKPTRRCPASSHGSHPISRPKVTDPTPGRSEGVAGWSPLKSVPDAKYLSAHDSGRSKLIW